MENEETIKVYNTKDVDLDVMLSEMGGGIKLTIKRVEPRWCDGYLDTIEVDTDDVVSMEDLRETYGGRKLSVRVHDQGGKIVATRIIKFPDPPRKDGIELRPPKPAENASEGGKHQEALITALINAQQQNTKQMIEFAEKQAGSMKDLTEARLRDIKSLSTTQPQSSSGLDSLKESMQLVESIEGLRDRLKDSGNDSTTKEQDIPPLQQKMLDMAEQFFTFKLEQEQQKIKHQLDQPKLDEIPDLPERENLKNKISDMELISQAAQRFQHMPLSVQQKAAEMFFGQLKTSQENMEQVDSEKNSDRTENLEGTGLDLDTDLSVDFDPDDLNELAGKHRENIPTP